MRKFSTFSIHHHSHTPYAILTKRNDTRHNGTQMALRTYLDFSWLIQYSSNCHRSFSFDNPRLFCQCLCVWHDCDFVTADYRRPHIHKKKEEPNVNWANGPFLKDQLARGRRNFLFNVLSAVAWLFRRFLVLRHSFSYIPSIGTIRT